jgi:hydroxymethylpyrimidine/phosphomethylpyrimidine kinase
MIAKSGDALLAADARDALITRLIPLALVVTPNLHEAGVLVGGDVRTLADMQAAACAIRAMGAANVVVKGGHLEDSAESVDLLFDGAMFRTLDASRIATGNTHGLARGRRAISGAAGEPSRVQNVGGCT